MQMIAAMEVPAALKVIPCIQLPLGDLIRCFAPFGHGHWLAITLSDDPKTPSKFLESIQRGRRRAT
jgi:hypothetical protein